jgi:hypothetical protein
MRLLQEIFKQMKKMEMPKLRDRNYVAKNSPTSGAGVHKDKSGKRASRAQQKQQWRKEDWQ